MMNTYLNLFSCTAHSKRVIKVKKNKTKTTTIFFRMRIYLSFLYKLVFSVIVGVFIPELTVPFCSLVTIYLFCLLL